MSKDPFNLILSTIDEMQKTKKTQISQNNKNIPNQINQQISNRIPEQFNVNLPQVDDKSDFGRNYSRKIPKPQSPPPRRARYTKEEIEESKKIAISDNLKSLFSQLTEDNDDFFDRPPGPRNDLQQT